MSIQELGGGVVLCDCMEVFKWNLKECGDALVLDSYLPADGTYVLIDLLNGGKILEQGVLKWDKKEKNCQEGIN